MDECGVCGGTAVGQGVVEGARLDLCDKCLYYAGKVVMYRNESEKRGKAGNAEQRPVFVPVKQKELVLAEGFGAVIQKAREARKLSRHDLAEKLFVREHELASFEEEKLKPVEKIARKIEFALGVKLLAEEDQLQEIVRESRSGNGDVTLGDLVKIRKK